VGLRQIRDVEFLGRVSDNDKARYFASADIFCAPSTGQESFGIVLLEAMAAGVPIIASDIHGYKNVVQRDVTGLLVEPRNHKQLAAALYALARDPELRHQLGSAGREQAPDYSWPNVTRKVVDFYHEVRDRLASTPDHAGVSLQPAPPAASPSAPPTASPSAPPTASPQQTRRRTPSRSARG
jgi:phosphatidylinositol alpha-mannosyltransferase